MGTISVTLTKFAKRNLTPSILDDQRETILAGVNNKSWKARGYTVESQYQDDGNAWSQDNDTSGTSKFIYTQHLEIVFRGAFPGKQEIAALAGAIHSNAKAAPVGVWTLATVNGEKYETGEDGEIVKDEFIAYAEPIIPQDWQEYFSHLYGLDAHIEMVMSSIQAGIDSDWNNRFSVALVGPPACGKSDTAETFRRMLGEDAVWKFDATAMTAAGIIKSITEAEILPRIIIVEEMEKAAKDALVPLLGMLDQRAEVRKTTARKDVQRDTKVLVIATINDWDLFCTLASGALESRMAPPIWFEKPDRQMLAMILTREIRKVNGDLRWIQPTLDYAEEKGIDDPRKIISICLRGGSRLLTGQYQKMLDATSRKG